MNQQQDPIRIARVHATKPNVGYDFDGKVLFAGKDVVLKVGNVVSWENNPVQTQTRKDKLLPSTPDNLRPLTAEEQVIANAKPITRRVLNIWDNMEAYDLATEVEDDILGHQQFRKARATIKLQSKMAGLTDKYGIPVGATA